VCKIIEEIGADFIQTSTGYGARGVELDDVRLIREVVTRNIGVKASGGIRTFKDAQALIDAGATRIGTSAGVEIMDEYITLFDK
jgi:deoxyribose-phosphate aldolase